LKVGIRVDQELATGADDSEAGARPAKRQRNIERTVKIGGAFLSFRVPDIG
jgi:hypothetical protein